MVEHSKLAEANFAATRSIVKERPALTRGIYEGVVVGNLLSAGLIETRIEGLGVTVPCIWASGLMASLLGFKTTFQPPIGTEVLLIYTEGENSFILPKQSRAIDPGQQTRHALDPSQNYHNLQQNRSRSVGHNTAAIGHKPPVDLVEGEIDISNLLGVGITFLENIALLKAGDLAKIECHLLDDMVRIVSDAFKHYTAFGDYAITRDGERLNVVWHGTSHDHEAWGNTAERDPKVSLSEEDTNVDLSKVDDTEDGRWRFSQFVGWMGNFINLFVTDPTRSLGKLASGAFRSGKARVHINNDGSILLQSVADIVLEKVVRIPIPAPLREEADPAGNRSDETLKKTEYLRNWVPTGDLFEMAFQLRSYARWLNNSYSLGRFHQLDRDWLVPTEASTPAPDVNNLENDKIKANPTGTNYRIAYATYRIFRDGSILHQDAYGNAYLSSQHGIHISSPKDITIEAGGSINLVAGRDMNLLARKNIGLTAVTEKVRIKAHTGLLMLSSAGHIVMETLSSFVVKMLATLNIDNTVQLSRTGAVDALGTITGLQLNAAASMINDSTFPHNGHVFPGAPTVTAVADDFQFQTDYGSAALYETVTQQMLRLGDLTGGNVTWNFSGNSVSGKGAPWPGAATHKRFSGGSSLQTPSAASIFSPNAQTPASANITLLCQP